MALPWPFNSIVLPTLATVLLLSLSLALGCGGERSPPSLSADAPGPSLTEGAVPECRVAFSPDEALRHVAEMAAARWSLATGCDVVVADDGVPMKGWQPALFVEYTDDGRALLASINHGGTMRSICGLSSWNDDEPGVRFIDVSMGCDVEYAVTHEMGHALAGVKGHAASGVLAEGDDPDRSPLIDEASLGGVCHTLPCRAPNPEG